MRYKEDQCDYVVLNKGVHKVKLEGREEQDFRGHHMLFYPECNGKQLKVFKDRSDSFQLMVLKYDSCVKNRLKWGTQIGVGRAIKKLLQ